jgi:Zn-dependent protease with chaperone function
MGRAPPAVWVIDDPTRNALALGRRPATAALVVTTGLVDALDPVALEGALAHELTHIRRGEVVSATVASAICLPLSVWPGAGDLVHALAGRGREFRTDQAAAAITRYPPGLREALLSIESGPAPRPGSVLGGRVGATTRRLWMVALPDGRRDLPAHDAVGDLDATSVRIAALDEW